MILSESTKNTTAHYLTIFLREKLFQCKIRGRYNRNQDHKCKKIQSYRDACCIPNLITRKQYNTQQTENQQKERKEVGPKLPTTLAITQDYWL
jgi:hypothetical protein